MNKVMVLATRKHLMTHPAYAQIFNELTAYCRDEYLRANGVDQIPSFDDLLQPQRPGRLMSAAE